MARKILICDDEDLVRALIRTSLGPDYEFVEARDGDEALACAAEHEPDLILLDVMMPKRTGLEVLKELRADPRFETAPIVILTASTLTSDRQEAEANKATCFLQKPFSPRELANVVATILA